MPGRNWCTSSNSHVLSCLHEQLLLIIWNGMGIQGIQNTKSDFSLRIEQDKAVILLVSVGIDKYQSVSIAIYS